MQFVLNHTGYQKVLEMVLKDLGIHYKRTVRGDRTMDNIGFCTKKNSTEKHIGAYISGFRMTNLSHWTYYKIGKKLMRYLQKKKFRTYIKAVYVDYALPNWHGYIDERVDKMLQGIDKNCTENIQTFTHCPAYKTLGTLHSQQKIIFKLI